MTAYVQFLRCENIAHHANDSHHFRVQTGRIHEKDAFSSEIRIGTELAYAIYRATVFSYLLLYDRHLAANQMPFFISQPIYVKPQPRPQPRTLAVPSSAAVLCFKPASSCADANPWATPWKTPWKIPWKAGAGSVLPTDCPAWYA